MPRLLFSPAQGLGIKREIVITGVCRTWNYRTKGL